MMLPHVLSSDMTGWDRAKTTRDKGDYSRCRDKSEIELVILPLVDLILYLYRQSHLD